MKNKNRTRKIANILAVLAAVGLFFVLCKTEPVVKSAIISAIFWSGLQIVSRVKMFIGIGR